MDHGNNRELNWAGEPQPTEEEQDRWSLYTIIISAVITVLGFTVFA
jgi:hypothetical protein